MPFYVSEWTGTGAYEDPFVPAAGAVAPGEWIQRDLRADEAQQAGYALVWTDTALPTTPGVFHLADGPDDPLSNPTVNSINNALGTDVPRGSSLREAVRWLNTVEATGPANGRWRAITPDVRGDYRIVLGDLVDTWT